MGEVGDIGDRGDSGEVGEDRLCDLRLAARVLPLFLSRSADFFVLLSLLRTLLDRPTAKLCLSVVVLDSRYKDGGAVEARSSCRLGAGELRCELVAIAKPISMLEIALVSAFSVSEALTSTDIVATEMGLLYGRQ